jgi:hypothetical protein
MTQEVILRPLTVEAWFNPRPALAGSVVNNVVLEQAFLREFMFSPVIVIPPKLRSTFVNI